MAAAPIVVRELDHIVLRVIDLPRMMTFYCDVLGCAIERDRQDIGLVQLRAGRSLVDLVPVDGPLGRAGGAAPGRDGRNLDHVCFRLETFDEHGIRTYLERGALRPSRQRRVTAPKATAHRFTSRIPKATRSSSRALRGPPK